LGWSIQQGGKGEKDLTGQKRKRTEIENRPQRGKNGGGENRFGKNHRVNGHQEGAARQRGRILRQVRLRRGDTDS